jgi:SAM-dependent methyltransferase
MLPERIYLLCTLLAIGLAACRNEATPIAEQPGLTREQIPETTGTPESVALPRTGEGNFENLVADFESKDRVIWQKPDMVIALLGDLRGKTVADIGAGSGSFTFRLVPKAKKVIGIDIDPRFITFMDSVKVRLPQQYQDQFESRLARPDDPLLKPGEADAVVIVNTYGYIENRVQYLKTLHKGMSDHGRLLIIDFKKNNLPIGPPVEFKVAQSQIERELRSAGFTITSIDNESLDYQYIVLAEKETADKTQKR